jgi:CP family cyanate transporter-like MFS transporter
VLDDIRDTLGMSNTGAGVLTMAPVLCFSLAAPLAARLSRSLGQEAIVFVSLLLVALGTLIRLAPSLAPVFVGTIVLGVGIAVVNVLMPSVIKRRFDDPGPMMGIFTASLSISAAFAAALTVPLEHALGSWRWALALWAVPALVAAVVWAPEARRSGSEPSSGTGAPVGLRRDRVAWLVTFTFAMQSLLFYSLLSWCPDILRDAGMSSGYAGAMLSLAMLLGIPASLAVPAIATRMRDQRVLALAAPILWALGWGGLLLDPAGPTWLWMAFVGVGQGTGISLALLFVVLRAPDGAHAAALSGMAQGVGYLIAALGPLLFGALHDATGGWDVPIALMLGAAAIMLATGIGAGRDRFAAGRDIPPTGRSSAPAP